jgi:hypothetical protein
MAAPTYLGVAEEAKRHFQDCSRVVVFDATFTVLYANCTVRC